jgi:excisionase family DNA binding protein
MKNDLKRTLQTETVVSVETASKALGVSRNHAYAAVRSGEIPSVRIGSRVNVPTAHLRRVLRIDE